MECKANNFQEYRFKIEVPLIVDMKDTVETKSLDGDGSRNATLKPNTLFRPIISRAAAQYQIDPDLVRAIIFAESGYNPKAVSKKRRHGAYATYARNGKGHGC
jgi:soluble lytic murein transglycosylase-like protein